MSTLNDAITAMRDQRPVWVRSPANQQTLVTGLMRGDFYAPGGSELDWIWFDHEGNDRSLDDLALLPDSIPFKPKETP